MEYFISYFTKCLNRHNISGKENNDPITVRILVDDYVGSRVLILDMSRKVYFWIYVHNDIAVFQIKFYTIISVPDMFVTLTDLDLMLCRAPEYLFQSQYIAASIPLGIGSHITMFQTDVLLNHVCCDVKKCCVLVDIIYTNILRLCGLNSFTICFRISKIELPCLKQARMRKHSRTLAFGHSGVPSADQATRT